VLTHWWVEPVGAITVDLLLRGGPAHGIEVRIKGIRDLLWLQVVQNMVHTLSEMILNEILISNPFPLLFLHRCCFFIVEPTPTKD
jgi:hypothetical protein